MLETKTFELRDRNTFIPIVAIRCKVDDGARIERTVADEYLLRRSGYGPDCDCVLLTRLDAHLTKASFDPWAWGDRTFTVAHNYIEAHWDELGSGEVIDVEYILIETTTKKTSERLS